MTTNEVTAAEIERAATALVQAGHLTEYDAAELASPKAAEAIADKFQRQPSVKELATAVDAARAALRKALDAVAAAKRSRRSALLSERSAQIEQASTRLAAATDDVSDAETNLVDALVAHQIARQRIVDRDRRRIGSHALQRT